MLTLLDGRRVFVVWVWFGLLTLHALGGSFAYSLFIPPGVALRCVVGHGRA